MRIAPYPDQFLEHQLSIYFRNMGNELWEILKKHITIKNGKIYINQKALSEERKKNKLIDKKLVSSIIVGFFVSYSKYLQTILVNETPRLVKFKNKKVLGNMPIVIDEIKSRRDENSFIKKFSRELTVASNDYQKAIIKKTTSSIPSKKIDINILKKNILLKSKIEEFWAQNIAGNYYAKSTKRIYREISIEEYTWVTRGDERVREEHKELNGSIRRVDTGLFPGEAYRCRCISIPYFRRND